MSYSILKKYIAICKILNINPTFEGLNKIKFILK